MMNESAWLKNISGSYSHIAPNAPYKEINFEADFSHPFTCIISGPSSSGKTTFIKKLIDISDTRIVPSPSVIVYVYTEWQSVFDEMKGVEFRKSIPSLNDLDNALLIIENFMNEIDMGIANFFTRGSHHRNVSVILVTQNLFHQNKHFRTCSLNAKYMIIFKNPRDTLQIKHLARSVFAGETNRFLEAYKNATERPFGYLLIDLRQSTPHNYRLRTWVLDEHPQGAAHQAVYYPQDTR